MTPNDALLFNSVFLPLVIAGWMVVALFPLAPRLCDALGGTIVPLGLSGGAVFAGLIIGDPSGPWGSPAGAAAGWVHLLAFGMAMGTHIASRAWRTGVPHFIVLPFLPVAVFAPPVALLFYGTLRLTLGILIGARPVADITGEPVRS